MLKTLKKEEQHPQVNKLKANKTIIWNTIWMTLKMNLTITIKYYRTTKILISIYRITIIGNIRLVTKNNQIDLKVLSSNLLIIIYIRDSLRLILLNLLSHLHLTIKSPNKQRLHRRKVQSNVKIMIVKCLT